MTFINKLLVLAFIVSVVGCGTHNTHKNHHPFVKARPLYYGYAHSFLPSLFFLDPKKFMHKLDTEGVEYLRTILNAYQANKNLEKIDPQKIHIDPIIRKDNNKLYFIEFPKPKVDTEVFYISLSLNNGTPRFFTLEKTTDIKNLGINQEGVFCEWRIKNGRKFHENFRILIKKPSKKSFMYLVSESLQNDDFKSSGGIAFNLTATDNKARRAVQATKPSREQSLKQVFTTLQKIKENEKNRINLPELDQFVSQADKAWLKAEYQKALKYLEQGLRRARELDNQKYIAIFLNNISIMYSKLDQYTKALENYKQAMVIIRKAGDRKGEGTVLINIGVVYSNLGRYAEALEYYQQSLIIDREIGSRKGEGVSLANIGTVYVSLGQYTKALEYLQQALAITREIGDRAVEGNILNNIGVIYKGTGQYAKAIAYYQQALTIKREIGNLQGVGDYLTNIGIFYRKLGQYPEALESYRQALTIKREIGDLAGEATDLTNISILHEFQHDYPQAQDSYQQALVLSSQISGLENQWRIWRGLSITTEKLHNPNAAIFYGKQAVNTIQRLRANVARLDDKALSQSFLKNKKHVYEGLADLLMRQGRLFEAQKVLELLKQEEYFDFIRRTRAFEIPDDALRYTPPEQPWAERYAEIGAQLVNLGQAYALLTDRKRRGEVLNARETRRLAELRDDLAVAERALQSWFTDMDSALADLKPADLDAMLRAFDDKREQLRSLLRDLGKGTVLLHYVPMPDTLHILVTTADLTLHREHPVKREAIANAVLALREGLKQAGRGNPPALVKGGRTSTQFEVKNVQAPAQQLHEWLIKPIADDLRRAGAQVLMVYLYGEMRYLPLAALYDGEHWLAEDYALAIYTAAADANLGKPRQPAWKVAGLGVSAEHEGFAPLPAVKAELEGIVRRNRQDRDGALPGEIHLDAAFTENRMFDVLERDFPVLHIASHFKLNVGKDTDSFLLLGDGKRLTLADIGVKKFAWQGLDMLALSACNTGMGLHGTGVEIEGLGTLVVKRGARSVLATLWQVSDQSTADFMQRLYASHAGTPLSKAKAIQQVQQAFIHAQKSGLPAYYAHPFHWAPFILMGNWL